MARLTLPDMQDRVARGEPLIAATAYDYAGIKLLEETGCDILMPWDQDMAIALFGTDSACGTTLDHVLFYLEGLAQAAERAFILAPLPFGSYECGDEQAIAHAATLLKMGADAVLVQGAGPTIQRVRALVEVGIPTAGWLGYLPHHVHRLGPDRVVADTAATATELYRDAQALSEAGAWGVFLCHVPARVADRVAADTGLITLAAGAGRGGHGYLARTHAALGWPLGQAPFGATRYADFESRAVAALNRFYEEVQQQVFPAAEHTFSITDDQYDAFTSVLDTHEE